MLIQKMKWSKQTEECKGRGNYHEGENGEDQRTDVEKASAEVEDDLA